MYVEDGECTWALIQPVSFWRSHLKWAEALERGGWGGQDFPLILTLPLPEESDGGRQAANCATATACLGGWHRATVTLYVQKKTLSTIHSQLTCQWGYSNINTCIQKRTGQMYFNVYKGPEHHTHTHTHIPCLMAKGHYSGRCLSKAAMHRLIWW